MVSGKFLVEFWWSVVIVCEFVVFSCCIHDFGMFNGVLKHFQYKCLGVLGMSWNILQHLGLKWMFRFGFLFFCKCFGPEIKANLFRKGVKCFRVLQKIPKP